MDFLLNLYADSNAPNLTPISDLVRAWGTVFLTFLVAVGAVVAAVFIAIRALQIVRSEDPNERSGHIKTMIWIILAFIVCAGGSVIFGVLSSSFFG